MNAADGRLTAEVEGEIATEGKVLVVRRILVRYRLVIDEADRETAARVHAVHADHCPVARTLRGCVEIETELETVDG